MAQILNLKEKFKKIKSFYPERSERNREDQIYSGSDTLRDIENEKGKCKKYI